MNVTPEMLLWLYEKINGQNHGWVNVDEFYFPHTDDAQFGRLVVWAWQNGIHLQGGWGVVSADTLINAVLTGEGVCFKQAYEDAPNSIRAAAVVAVCRALGYQEAANVPER